MRSVAVMGIRSTGQEKAIGQLAHSIVCFKDEETDKQEVLSILEHKPSILVSSVFFLHLIRPLPWDPINHDIESSKNHACDFPSGVIGHCIECISTKCFPVMSSKIFY